MPKKSKCKLQKVSLLSLFENGGALETLRVFMLEYAYSALQGLAVKSSSPRRPAIDETTAKAVFRFAGDGAMFCQQAKPRVGVAEIFSRR